MKIHSSGNQNDHELNWKKDDANFSTWDIYSLIWSQLLLFFGGLGMVIETCDIHWEL